MPYVERNSSGEIVALFATRREGAEEFLPPEDDAVIAFLAQADGDDAAFPLASDLKMIRVIEDLVDLLIAKNVILFTELPQAVQDKILAQKSHREKVFGASTPLMLDDDGPLF